MRKHWHKYINNIYINKLYLININIQISLQLEILVVRQVGRPGHVDVRIHACVRRGVHSSGVVTHDCPCMCIYKKTRVHRYQAAVDKYIFELNVNIHYVFIIYILNVYAYVYRYLFGMFYLRSLFDSGISIHPHATPSTPPDGRLSPLTRSPRTSTSGHVD